MACPRCGRPDADAATCGCSEPGGAAASGWTWPPRGEPVAGPAPQYPPPPSPAWGQPGAGQPQHPSQYPPPPSPAWGPPGAGQPQYPSQYPPSYPPQYLPPGGGPAPAWSAPPAPRRRWRGAVIAGAVLVAIIGAAVAGSSLHSNPSLPSQIVASPGPGMVATATGAGGPSPVSTLPGAQAGPGIRASGVVPTAPTIYLEPAQKTVLGVKGSKEAAYWKVWWDGTAQVKAVVSLQQHVDASNATRALGLLARRNADPTAFNNGTLDFTRTRTFTVPGVPGATGYVWDGTEGSGANGFPIEFRFATFSRGSVVALVSLTAYSEATDEAAFDAFARAEYSKLG